jgi:hypothetical protein
MKKETYGREEYLKLEESFWNDIVDLNVVMDSRIERE